MYLLFNSSLARALLFIVFWIVVPGFAMVSFFVGRLSLLNALIGFYLGLAQFSALFFISRLVSAFYMVMIVVPPGFSVAFIVYKCVLWFKNGRKAGLDGGGKYLGFAVAAAVGIYFSFYMTVYSVRAVTYIVNPDFLWHMGNIWTLAYSPGFEDIRVAGMVFKYHYFSDLIWAGAKVATGIDVFDAVLRLPVALVPLLMSAGLCELMKKLVKNRWLACAGAVVILVAGPMFGRYNDFSYQWATNVNAVGVALPAGIALVLYTHSTLERKTVAWKQLVVSMLLMAVLSGLKGPFALCVLMGTVGVSLFRLRWKAPYPKRWIIYVAGQLAAFFIVWLLLLSTGLNEGYIKSWQPLYSVHTAAVLKPVLDGLGNGMIARLAALPMHLVVIFGLMVVPFLISCVKYIKAFFAKTQVEDITQFTLACSVAPVIVFYMLDLTGRSQFYFMYFAVPFVIGLGLGELETVFLPWLKGKKILCGGAAVAAAALFVFSVCNNYYEQPYPAYTPSEVEAVEWLKQNVGKDERVATNKHGTMYLATGISGRKFWLEGSSYAKNSGVTEEMLQGQRETSNKLFMENVKDKDKIAKEIGVSWLLQYTRETDPELLAMPGDGFELVWQDEDALIWHRTG